MRKQSLRISVIFICILMAAALFAGCGTPAISRPSQTPGVATVKVTGNCSIAIQNGVVTVSGQTSIPDGATIQIAVLGQDGMTIDSVIIKKSGDKISHDFNMADKKDAYAKASLKSIYGFITCAPKLYGAQAPAVYQLYGDNFQNIDYTDEETKTHYIWDKEGNILVFQSDKADLSK